MVEDICKVYTCSNCGKQYPTEKQADACKKQGELAEHFRNMKPWQWYEIYDMTRIFDHEILKFISVPTDKPKYVFVKKIRVIPYSKVDTGACGDHDVLLFEYGRDYRFSYNLISPLSQDKFVFTGKCWNVSDAYNYFGLVPKFCPHETVKIPDDIMKSINFVISLAEHDEYFRLSHLTRQELISMIAKLCNFDEKFKLFESPVEVQEEEDIDYRFDDSEPE